MMNWIKKEFNDYKVLLRSVPGLITTIFVLSTVAMNLLANKEFINVGWLALDCGILVAWAPFLCMDMVCKRFGAKAGIKLSVFALFVNLCMTGIFKLATLVPGMWGAYYDSGLTEVNVGLNSTFGGTWYVVLGSSVAMLVSAIVNSLLNVGVGKICRKDNFGTFAARAYISTMVAQFVDNLVFGMMVSKVFFGWSWTAVITCALTGAIAELLMEVIFSPIGYRVSKKWTVNRVGQEYIDLYATV